MAESPILIPGGIIEEGPERLIIVPDDYEYPEPSPDFYPWPADPNEKAVIGSGTLKLRANIGAEVGLGSSSNVKLNASCRDLIGKAASAQTKMSEFYGASSFDFDKTKTQAQAGGGYAGYGESYYNGGSGNATSWGISIGCRGGSGVAPDAYNWLWANLSSLKGNTTYRCNYDITLTRSGPFAGVYIGFTSKNFSGWGFNWSHNPNWGGLSGTYVGGNSGPPYSYDVSWREGDIMVNYGGGQTSTRNASYFDITSGTYPYFCVGVRCRGNSNGNSGSGSITVHSLTLTEL